MTTFVAVNDELIANRIGEANARVIYIAPAISVVVANAIGECYRRAHQVSVTVVLDPDEGGYRLGFGDVDGLKRLQDLANQFQMAIRGHAGLRVGLLVVDGAVLFWSPTARSVEAQRENEEANGLDLGERVVIEAVQPQSARDANAPVECLPMASFLTEVIASDDSRTALKDAEIGQSAMLPAQVAETVRALTENPPAPFDLARKTRVFSTKFQFVELEMRGVEWTGREITLDSVLLNADAPEDLRAAFKTKIAPYSHMENVSIDVPAIVAGEVAYNKQGDKILAPMTQAELEKAWKAMRDRYLVNVLGFGKLIRRSDKQKFESEVKAFEEVVVEWVAGFREKAAKEDDALIDRIVGIVLARVKQSTMEERPTEKKIREIVEDGVERMRVSQARIKIVFKDVSWESTRDNEFMGALKSALSPTELKGWVETFIAAREKNV